VADGCPARLHSGLSRSAVSKAVNKISGPWWLLLGFNGPVSASLLADVGVAACSGIVALGWQIGVVYDARHARGDRAQSVRGPMVVVGVALVCAIVVADEGGGAKLISLRSREKCPPLGKPSRWLLLLTLQSADLGRSG